MGFTRSWKQPYGINATTWRAIVDDVGILFKQIDCTSLEGFAGADEGDADATGVFVSAEEIAFNGRDEEAAEVFSLRRVASDFECVKTYGRSYDLLVAAVLVIAKHHSPNEILNVSSDDDVDDAWRPALEFCRASGVSIPSKSVQLLMADVDGESVKYEPAKDPAEQQLDAEWARDFDAVKVLVEAMFAPTYLRYQAVERFAPASVRLKLRRSVDARALPPNSPVLREKVGELERAWNKEHTVKIRETVIG
jgi:hypothetical protein